MKRLALAFCTAGMIGCSASSPSRSGNVEPMVRFSYSETIAPNGAEETSLKVNPAPGENAGPSRVSWSRSAKRGTVEISISGTARESRLVDTIRSYASLLWTLNPSSARRARASLEEIDRRILLSTLNLPSANRARLSLEEIDRRIQWGGWFWPF